VPITLSNTPCLFAQIGRLLTLNGLHTLTKEVVEAAPRECLIIGMT